MQIVKSASIVSAFVLGLAAPALAQQSAAPVEAPVRGYLVGGVGASTGAQAAPTFSAEIGDHVTRDVQVYATLSYYDNLMSEAAGLHLAQVSNDLTALTGTSWNFQGRDRAYALTVGAKYLFGYSPVVRPYVGAGVGIINLERIIREQSRGNLTSAFLSEFGAGAGDGVVDVTQEDTTKPLGELTAGVGVVVGPAYVDFGYRFRKGFHTMNESFEFSQLGASVGFKF